MAETTLEGKMHLWLTATISAEWDTDHYDFTVEGVQDGIVGITGKFLCDYKGELVINDGEINLDDAIDLRIIGVDVSGTDALVCKIENINQ